jgi:hypothetical protein
LSKRRKGMSRKYITFLMGFLFLAAGLAATHAQDLQHADVQKVEGKVIRLYDEELAKDIDIDAFMETGEVRLQGGLQCFPPMVMPGPAPDPYPHVHVLEKGIEQLGRTSENCDGIWFINGNLWLPRKYALVLWKIRIPEPSSRFEYEFTKDLTVSLWVDFNQDKNWGKEEKVITRSFNIEEFFPYRWPYLEIWYLTCFRIPSVVDMIEDPGDGKKYTTKLWARGVLSYDDLDASPDGESVFGEVEDYQLSYFEIIRKDKKRDDH